MRDDITNVVIAGLGGQGVVTASDILAEAAFRAGCDVKKAEVHGMSQRGGSVTTDVRFGRRVLSPMVPAGEGDYLVVMEETQADASRARLRPEGRVLLCTEIDPQALPTAKALNVAMMGMLSAYLEIPEPVWLDALRAGLPEKLHAVNVQAFQIGRSVGKEKCHA